MYEYEVSECVRYPEKVPTGQAMGLTLAWGQ